MAGRQSKVLASFLQERRQVMERMTANNDKLWTISLEAVRMTVSEVKLKRTDDDDRGDGP